MKGPLHLLLIQGGVIVSVDSRATQGPFIASQTVKMIEINPFLLGTWLEVLVTSTGRETWAENLNCTSSATRRGSQWPQLQAACEYDVPVPRIRTEYGHHGDGVGQDGPSAVLRRQRCDANPRRSVQRGVGVLAYGVLDNHYRCDLTDEEAIGVGKEPSYATHRDAYSGGVNNVYHVKEDGWVQVWKGDTTDMYWYYPRASSLSLNLWMPKLFTLLK